MATQLETVNRVLRRLREDQVATVTENTYSILIAEFVNAAIEEVRDAHVWARFKTSTYSQILAQYQRTINLSKNVSASGDISDGNPTFDEYSKLTWTGHDSPIVGARKSNDTKWQWISPLSLEQERAIYEPNQEIDFNYNTADMPTHFSFGGGAAGSLPYDGDMLMHIWPYTDNANVQIVMYGWFPQALMALDATDDNTEILYPHRPLFQYALMLALNERGEEIGEPGNIAEEQYVSALGAAIEHDIEITNRTNESDWRRD
jgi:hypothetical protein